MNEVASRLVERVVRIQVGFSAAASLLLPWAIPHLLLIDPIMVTATTEGLFWAMLTGGVVAITITTLRLRRHQFVLRALALGSGSVEAHDVGALGAEPARMSRTWLAPHVVTLGAFASPWRPDQLDPSTGISVALLGIVVVAAASLPFHVLVRASIVRAIELAPTDVMREVVAVAEQRGRTADRIPRRMVNAVATPVAFVALGSALIANAHLRRADEYSREETARAIARASLELGPGLVQGAGLEDAIGEARSLGFSATLSEERGQYSIERTGSGATVLVTPLDVGNATMVFSGSTVPVLSGWAFFVTLGAVLTAALGGLLLGRIHGRDLRTATEGIRLLGTDTVIGGGRLSIIEPKFRVVAELQHAIERLADRFRVFAQAQELAIDAREAASRMRGLFFASVSHDLKSPLNAILGFAELVRAEPLTPGQSESLDVIRRRGKELLALIETILDAARVEAGQLSLAMEAVETTDLLGDAIRKARELSPDPQVEVVGEIRDDVGAVSVDRLRVARALGTLIAYGIRHAQEPVVRVRAMREGDDVRVFIEVPSRTVGYRDLERMLSGVRPSDRQHRGLALGVSLSRSILELHDGQVTAVGRSAASAAFAVTLHALDDPED